jgi:signal peptidase II
MIKDYVKDYVSLHSRKKLVGDKVILTKIFNKGAMLGVMSENPELLKKITIFGIGGLVGALTMLSGKRGHRLQKLGLSMMLGGAGSNAYERLRYGKVTDYVRFNVGSEKFRSVVYNIGDFAVFAGTIFLLLGEWLTSEK